MFAALSSSSWRSGWLRGFPSTSLPPKMTPVTELLRRVKVSWTFTGVCTESWEAGCTTTILHPSRAFPNLSRGLGGKGWTWTRWIGRRSCSSLLLAASASCKSSPTSPFARWSTCCVRETQTANGFPPGCQPLQASSMYSAQFATSPLAARTSQLAVERSRDRMGGSWWRRGGASQAPGCGWGPWCWARGSLWRRRRTRRGTRRWRVWSRRLKIRLMQPSILISAESGLLSLARGSKQWLCLAGRLGTMWMRCGTIGERDPTRTWQREGHSMCLGA
mmetsp:Transcript_46267/g.111366  ORF Transcript_46267/g.111366 Transcript_46267/m.111366 type:complete len:276 (-) Transcript_46267:975-1802(-)